MRRPIVLASQSPRRAQLLGMLGLAFEVAPAHVDESLLPGEDPKAHAERLARDKAAAVAHRYPQAFVVGSDTVVVIDGDVLGKPRDVPDAIEMLMRLQGRTHTVETGIAVAFDGDQVISSLESVAVRFRAFDEATAEAYARTGEPLDKAGAYGIQGYGSTLVEGIEGDFFAVMGLPVARLVQLFEQLGWRYMFDHLEAQ